MTKCVLRHIVMYKKVGGDFHSANEKSKREMSEYNS